MRGAIALSARAALWAALGLAAGLLAAIALPLAFGGRPLTVLSGSMTPTLHAGDVVVVDRIRPAQTGVGDVITFRDPRGRLITHRVRGVQARNGRFEFITRGDANNAGERWTLPADGRLSRAVFRVPMAGRLLSVTSSPPGRLVLVVIPLLLLGVIELRRIWRPREAAAYRRGAERRLYSVDGVSYNYRSALLTADNPLSEGSKAYTITAADNASNSATQSGFGVIVDNTSPAPTDVQAANNNSTPGQAEINDTIIFSFSEPIDPSSILPGWNGSATNVVVRLTNTALLGADTVEIYNAGDSATLPFGSVDLGGSGYVGGVLGGEVARFGATGAASTMAVSGNQITITLGTHSGQGATTALVNTTMTWLPSTTPTDRAGNASTNPNTSESGAADKEF